VVKSTVSLSSSSSIISCPPAFGGIVVVVIIEVPLFDKLLERYCTLLACCAALNCLVYSSRRFLVVLMGKDGFLVAASSYRLAIPL